MDEAAERRIEERLAARFGNKIPAAAYDARGLQTWGTFFRNGTAEEEQPERPASPYTSLFLQDTIPSMPNGEMNEEGKKDGDGKEPEGERNDADADGKEAEVGQKRPRPEGKKDEGAKESEGDRNDADADGKEAEAGQKWPRPDDGEPEVKKLLKKGDGPDRKTDGPSDSGAGDGAADESEEESGESEEDEDEESSEEESSSPSDAEDELSLAASFRNQVADNERYRKRMRDAHAPG